jgi:choice-of-anchor A domain-containing protein
MSLTHTPLIWMNCAPACLPLVLSLQYPRTTAFPSPRCICSTTPGCLWIHFPRPSPHTGSTNGVPVKRIALLVLSTLLPLSATTLYGVGNYNVLTFNTFNATGADSGGAFAAGGNITLPTGYQVGSGPIGLQPSFMLVGGGSLAVQFGYIENGTGVAASGWAASGFTNGSSLSLGTLSSSGGNPINFASVQAGLNAQSIQLSGLAANGSYAVSFGTVTLSGSSSTQNVFNITSAQLAAATSGIRVCMPAGSTAIINVSGTSVSSVTSYTLFGDAACTQNLGGPNGNSTNAGVAKIVWNMYQATSVTLNNSSFGSVLAPLANVTGSNSQLDGQLIALSYNGAATAGLGSVEFHDFIFNGNLPPSPAPEPGSLLLTGGGLGALLFALRRRNTHIDA